MRSARLLSFVTILLVAPALPGAQVIVNQTRVGGDGIQLPGMPGREVKTGTGRLRGRIVAGDTGGAVRRAQVRLSGPEIGVKTAVTDASGLYEFRDLPAGRFTLTATKSGFVTVSYGQTRPFESGKTIELADGQQLDKADVAMPRGGVIAGRVVDEFGDPMPDTMITALRSTWSNGRRRLQPTGRPASTNDLGQYRLFGLPPGEYFVSASLTGSQMFQMEMALAVTMSGASSQGSTPASGYAPTYFPGTTNGAEAQRVTVAIGQDALNTDFALTPVRLAKVSGTVLNSDGRPAEGTMVNAVPRSTDGNSPLMGLGNSARTDRNGNFTISGVAPGEYTLLTRGMQIISAGEGRTMVFTMRTSGEGAGPSEPEVGSVPITVSGDDLANVVLMTARGGTAAGEVIFEGGAKPGSTAGLRVRAAPTDGEGPSMLPGGSVMVAEDGTFTLRGLAGGRVIRAMNVPSGWILKSVRLNGQDVTDTGVEFKAGEAVTGLEVVLTNRITSVTGSVRSGTGEPVKDYTVVVFAADETRWAVPDTRWVTGVRPDQEGRFQVRGLPAGGYYAIALEYVEQGTWGDPELLARLAPLATSFSLDEGEAKTLDLKISR